MWNLCSVTLSANVCTARVCTAIGGFRSVPEGCYSWECVWSRGSALQVYGIMVALGHGKIPDCMPARRRECSKLMAIYRVWELWFKQRVPGRYGRRNDPARNAVRPKP